MRDGKGVHLLGIHIITGRRVQRRRRGESKQTRQRDDKSPTSKIYTTWACILSDRNIFCTLKGVGDNGGILMPVGLFLFIIKCQRNSSVENMVRAMAEVNI